MKQQAFNPYLPSWEYIPDGEPYVFDGRVYIYGSHDRFNGHAYCLNDYVTWSAPVDDLGNWRYEGVIYEKTQDPFNADGSMCLYAPDVTQGPDGRYYLYYVLDKKSVVSVAVCDSPAGKFQFYGYVHYADGTLLGEREGDEPQFDPGVLTEGENTYLYTGFCFAGDKSRHGPMCTVLGPDMLTIRQEPVFIAPSQPYSQGSGFEGHEFFEAPSIRKAGDTYYFIYSSVVFHELCYATSKSPTQGFQYGGVIISNNDLGIGTYKPADKPMYYGGNNHGSMVQIGEKWYIFYHRQTNGTEFSRQGCAEKLEIAPDGSIRQVEITSCGLNGGPLKAEGAYPAAIACHITSETTMDYIDYNDPVMKRQTRITAEETGSGHSEQYVTGIEKGSKVGYKYFDFDGAKTLTLTVRGNFSGSVSISGDEMGEKGAFGGELSVHSGDWTEVSYPVSFSGKSALYLTFDGEGSMDLKTIAFA